MAFVTDTNPNAGTNFGDFLINKLLPFLRDNMGWVDNQVPTRSPDVSLGNATSELWTHRGSAQQSGSPGVGSPFNQVGSPPAQPPFIFWRSEGGDYGLLATGYGGTASNEEWYDQPNNPCNGPRLANLSDIKTSPQRQEIQIQPALDGPYSAYWLFGPGDGTYCHVVLKVAARHYRHFWFGLLDRFASDVDPETFYVCGHHWEEIAPDNVKIGAGSNLNTAPYTSTQMPPGAPGSSLTQGLDSPKHQHRSVLYSPGLRTGGSPTVGIDWFYSGDWQGAPTTKIAKPVGTIGTPLDVGYCQFTSYGPTLGAALFRCDESFTANVKPLIPVLCFVNTPFEANERWGCIGQVPDVFRINMNGLSAESEIVVGSDTFVIFPVTNNDSANHVAGEPYSGFEGYAYKKILGSP
jgi:hypothetical protein